MKHKFGTFAVFLLMFLLPAALLKAQGGSAGTILGTVTDSTGATVPNAAVDITNVETSVTEHAVTTSSGDFSVPSLHPGVYKVTVTAPGFQSSVTNQITVAVDQRARVDVSLKNGNVSEIVEVAASQVRLDTDTAEIAQTVTAKQVVDLPINSRNFVSLLFLSSGAVMTGGESGGSSGNGAKGNGAISINGGRSSSNQYLIDGMYNNDTVYQTPAISPSIDAVQEFKLQSGAYSAEFGGSANQVNISFRSGTNTYHGTAFDFLRNDAFDAYSAFDDRSKPKNLLRQNQFGFTLGGPIFIPKIYNGKDKSFFFANYEGIRIHQTGTVLATVPTQAMLGIGTPNGAAIIPQSAIDYCVTPACPAQQLVNPQAGYTPFARDGSGNYIVPSSAFSNFGRQARSHIPLPNASIGSYNYASKLAIPTLGNQQNYRFDQTLGQKNALFFRYSVAEFIRTSTGVGLTPEGQQNNVSQQRSYMGGYTRTFNSSLINQFRFGYLQSDSSLRGIAASQADLSGLGFKGLYTLTSTPYAQISFNKNYAAFGGAATNDPQIFNQPTYDMADSLVITRGKHSLTTGVAFRTLTMNHGGNANVGSLTFDGQFSNSQVADFLLGNYQTAGGSSPTPFSTPGEAGTIVHIKHWFLAPYIQDDWKPTQRLTLNLGLRYDFNSVPYNQNNHFGWFDPTGPGYFQVADKALIDQGIGGNIYKYAGGRTAFAAQKNVFAPRFGFAFRPTDKTVLRGGYGIFFDSSEDSETRQFAEFYPYSVRQQLTKTRATGTGQADQLFPAITNLSPVSSDNLGFLLTQINAKKNPMVQQFNLSLQRQIGNATKAEVAYSGTTGQHLLGRQNINQPFAYNPARPTSVASRTPYSNFGAVILVDQFNNSSNYHAFNAKLETNTHGLTLLAAYTWSKSMDTKSAAAGVDGDTAGWAGAQDPHNLAAEYARSGYDVGQRLVVSFVDELPIGRGKLLDFHNKPLNAVFGGFQLNAIATFQGGFPFSVNGTDNSGLNGTVYGERANIVAGSNPTLARGTRNAAKWFNTSLFSNPAPGTYGNSGRNIVRAPGVNNWDTSAFRNINIFERVSAQLRVETFNTFNHTILGAPDTNVNNARFGSINGTRIPGRIVQLGAKIIF